MSGLLVFPYGPNGLYFCIEGDPIRRRKLTVLLFRYQQGCPVEADHADKKETERCDTVYSVL